MSEVEGFRVTFLSCLMLKELDDQHFHHLNLFPYCLLSIIVSSTQLAVCEIYIFIFVICLRSYNKGLYNFLFLE